MTMSDNSVAPTVLTSAPIKVIDEETKPGTTSLKPATETVLAQIFEGQSSELVAELTKKVDELTKLDDRYISVQKELNEKIRAVELEFQSRFEPLMKERLVVLTNPGKGLDGQSLEQGTPGFPKFWLTVLQHTEFESRIEKWDEPILEYLRDITTNDIDPTDPDKGFQLKFWFVENPHFKNTCVTKTYITQASSEFLPDQLEVVKVESDSIEWNEGKDVSVELKTRTKKPTKKGQSKRTVTEEVKRPTFFKYFRSINEETELSDDEEDSEDERGSEDSEDAKAERLQMVLEEDWEMAVDLRDRIIPHAIRYFTGEVYPDEDDEEGDEDEGDSDSDSD